MAAPAHKLGPFLPIEVALPGFVGALTVGARRREALVLSLAREWLVEAKKRKRRRADYRRFERARAMQLWQMDIVGGFHLADGTDLKAVTGLDDHSRYCVSVHLVLPGRSRPTCEALRAAIKTCGVPEPEPS